MFSGLSAFIVFTQCSSMQIARANKASSDILHATERVSIYRSRLPCRLCVPYFLFVLKDLDWIGATHKLIFLWVLIENWTLNCVPFYLREFFNYVRKNYKKQRDSDILVNPRDNVINESYIYAIQLLSWLNYFIRY